MVSGLRGRADLESCYAELARWSAADDVARLEELGHALLAAPGHPLHDSVFERVERLLVTTPSEARAAAVVRLSGGLPPRRVRWTARLLAHEQHPAVLLSLDLPLELGACLVHELVLLGVPVPDGWRSRLAGHPLGALPLELLPSERAAVRRAELTTTPGVVPAAVRRATPEDVTAAVTTWLTESNGRAEAAVFTVPPLAAADVGTRTVESLGLDCAAGNGLALRPSALPEVVRVLFDAASAGGAYDRGQGGAYGRLAAWRSVGALAAGAGETCAWWVFDAANDWFHRIAWDLGVLCLRPGGRGLAVLAATDTD